MPIRIDEPHRPWSRLIRFHPTSNPSWTLLGEPIDGDMDIGLAIAENLDVFAHVLEGSTNLPWDQILRRTGKVERVHKLLSPLSRDMCGIVRCIGLNYKDHAAELNLPLPQTPTLFFKPPQSITHPNHPIPIPKICQDDEMDYEVELAIVLGMDTKDVSEEEAMGRVLGFMVGNDLTARKVQLEGTQWGFSKGFDSFCPIGPCIVSTAAFGDPKNALLQTRLNGELLQDGTARKMIFSIPRIISHLSQGTTLPAGTIILTGTPPGIGVGRTPKIWLEDGDTVECWVSGGIGTLVNTIEYS